MKGDFMKGIIVYSSKTGNTKKMAEYIYDAIKDLGDIQLKEIKGKMDLSSYDFALIGGWIDKGFTEKKTLDLLKNTSQENIGIFGTMGAHPKTKHGQDVYQNLTNLLQEKNSLGVFLCPGLVDPKLIDNLKRIPEHVLPKEIVTQMYEASVTSRHATEEELQEAAHYFMENIKTTM